MDFGRARAVHPLPTGPNRQSFTLGAAKCLFFEMPSKQLPGATLISFARIRLAKVLSSKSNPIYRPETAVYTRGIPADHLANTHAIRLRRRSSRSRIHLAVLSVSGSMKPRITPREPTGPTRCL